MLCSISQASFASQHWNALKTNFQHVPSPLENTFFQQAHMGRYLQVCSQHMILWKDSKVTFQRSDKLCLTHTLYTTHSISPDSTVLHTYLLPMTVSSKKFLGGRVETSVEESTVCQASSNLGMTRNYCPHLTYEDTEFREVTTFASKWCSQDISPELSAKTRLLSMVPQCLLKFKTL